MRSILAGLLFSVILVGCSKKSDVQLLDPAEQQITLKNQNISVVNVNLKQTGGNQVTFNFTTQYEKNLKSIELLSGASETLFCSIYSESKTENSLQEKNYTIVDNDPKWNTTYYMLKYTTQSGDWYCSTVYKVNLAR